MHRAGLHCAPAEPPVLTLVPPVGGVRTGRRAPALQVSEGRRGVWPVGQPCQPGSGFSEKQSFLRSGLESEHQGSSTRGQTASPVVLCPGLRVLGNHHLHLTAGMLYFIFFPCHVTWPRGGMHMPQEARDSVEGGMEELHGLQG